MPPTVPTTPTTRLTPLTSGRAAPSPAVATALPLAFEQVTRSYGGRTVLGGIDLEVAAGEIVTILGPSGGGKSTLLRILGGLDRPSGGRVSIAGSPVAPYDPRCAIGFQEPRLLPWRTLAQNVALGLPRGLAKTDAAQRVSHLLELVGLTHAAEQRPREVSGGMAQRASLARALARNPGVLLLDEPFGALDALTRLKMQDLLLDVHANAPTTVLLVTHDVDEALQLGDRVVLLGSRGDSRSDSREGSRDESDEGQDGTVVARVVAVPGERPRDRGDARLAHLRAELLAGLGIDTHRNPPQRNPPQ
ncbi:ABC transporter ATP-binding protein [Gryllotalpicola ginsengisoli]|uniref:ABC transporter ATP-binding protein n=1 Tax=Gryllotalpicola ginsengisoli TaxID=444608 RepID=UPI0003B343CE|nr:ABC transporter ATP-binding protein [Gryllotalpicola ginsengisoli]